MINGHRLTLHKSGMAVQMEDQSLDNKVGGGPGWYTSKCCYCYYWRNGAGMRTRIIKEERAHFECEIDGRVTVIIVFSLAVLEASNLNASETEIKHSLCEWIQTTLHVTHTTYNLCFFLCVLFCNAEYLFGISFWNPNTYLDCKPSNS